MEYLREIRHSIAKNSLRNSCHRDKVPEGKKKRENILKSLPFRLKKEKVRILAFCGNFRKFSFHINVLVSAGLNIDEAANKSIPLL